MWPVPSTDSALPATLYKFCIILAMNSFLRSKTDSSKGKEGPETGGGGVRCTLNPYLRLWRPGDQGPWDKSVGGWEKPPGTSHRGQVQALEGFRARAQGEARSLDCHLEIPILLQPSEAVRPFLMHNKAQGGHPPSRSHTPAQAWGECMKWLVEPIWREERSTRGAWLGPREGGLVGR